MPSEQSQSRIKQLAGVAGIVALSVGGVVLLSKLMAPMGRGGIQCGGRCAPPGSEQIAAMEQLVVGAVVVSLLLVVGIRALEKTQAEDVEHE